MLSKLAKTIKKSFRGLGEKGYTLIEVAAVVAVTATLAAVVVPVAVDKVNQAKITSANMQCKQIGAAITGFVKDTGIFPTRDSSGQDRSVAILYSGEYANFSGSLPVLTGADWVCTSLPSDTDCRLYNHLGRDDGRYTGTAGDGVMDWKGPYLDEIGTDPWGRPYLVLSAGFCPYNADKDPNAPSDYYGWILSAGPNGKVDTYGKGSVLNGDSSGNVQDEADDIGYVFYRYQPAQTGCIP